MTAARSRGMSLVEMMVWIAVSLIIVSVIGAIYLNTKQVTRVTDTISRLQENGRFVMHLLDRDVRMAGFRGCNGGSITPVNVLGSAAYPYQFNIGIVGYHDAGSGWSPALDASITSLVPPPLSGRDVITIRHIDGAGIPLIATMSATTGDVQVSAGTALTAGDLLLIADCGAAAIFQATAVAGGGLIAHEAGAGTPGNSTKDLGHVFGSDASVYRLVTRTYYVAASVIQAGTNALWSYSNPNYDGRSAPEEMVEGVEQLVYQFGEDTDGDHAANRYLGAGTVANWDNVVSVKAQLLLATVRDNAATNPQPYTFNGETTTPTDLRLRSPLTSMITLRNRVP